MTTHKSNRIRGCKPETEAKYRPALELYASTALSIAEICRKCGISISGFSRYIGTYHRHLMLHRNGIKCKPEDARNIQMNQRRGQLPVTHAKYKEAIAACDSMDYIDCNVSQIAREFGLSGTNLGRQLRTHYPEVLEVRERARQRLGLDDGLPRGTRPWCKEQYAEALHLYRTTPMSVRKIAKQTGVSLKGLYDYLQTWHKDLVCQRKGIAYEEGKPVDLSSVRRYNLATAAKYADAIARLKEGGLTTAKVAAEFVLQPEGFRQYLKEHEPELHASLGMKKTENGGIVAPHSMGKYGEALHIYATTAESIKSLASRFGFNGCSFSQFVRRQFPELHKQHQKLVLQTKKAE